MQSQTGCIHYDALIKSSAAMVLAFSTRIIEIFAYGIGAIFLALYMMRDRDRLRGGLFEIVPQSHSLQLACVMLSMEGIVDGYVRGQLTTCALMSIVMFTLPLPTACGIPNALTIAVLVAALTLGPVVAVIALVLMLAFEEFESRVPIPMVYDRALRLLSSAVFFADCGRSAADTHNSFCMGT